MPEAPFPVNAMQISSQILSIRGLIIDPPLLLAPMAGLTHCAFRRLLCGMGGVGLLSTEMLSAKRLPTENAAVSPFLIRTEEERPLSYQLLTSQANEVGPAIEALHSLPADAIDINMGCPAPAVGRIGAGIRLMENAGEACGIVREARKRTSRPLTAKIRIGIRDDQKLQDFCAMLQDEGIDLLSVHARLQHESFARTPHWGRIEAIKHRLTIPVIANGGVFSVQDAKACLAASGADGLMLGRGAVVRPWLFAEIAREVYGRDIPAPDVSLPALFGRFLEGLELFRPVYRLGRLKEYTHYFARNYRFGHHLASRVQSSATVEEARERASLFFEQGS